MALLRDAGIVLRTYKLGEADRIIVLMTREHGKVRAVAKGVRKTGSRFGSRLEPLCHVSLLLWRGRSDLDIVNQVEVIARHQHVRADFDRLSAGLAMLEVVDQVTQEAHVDERTLDTLARALGVLDDTTRDPTMVAPSFFLRMLEIEGAGPIVDACASCGRDDVDLVAFDLLEGGALCGACRRGRPLSGEALVLLRRIIGGDLAGVLAGSPPPGAAEVASLATEAMEAHLDRRLRAVRTRTSL
jgi:DNA repair protein RecO (recombination protein O)